MAWMKSSLSIAVGSACLCALLAFQTQCAAADALAYVTNQGDGVAVVDLATLKTVRTFEVGRDPRGVGITPDGRTLVTANQADGDVSLVDTSTGNTVHRIAVGQNAEFVRVSQDGRFAYVTYEPSSTGKPPGPDDKGGKTGAEKATKEDKSEAAEIAVIDLTRFTVSQRLPASLETEGMEFSPGGKQLVVANEGDDTVVVYDLASGQVVKKIDVSPYGKRPRGVKVSPDGSMYVVTLENSDNLLVLDPRFDVVKAVATGKGPYGVAFEPGGNRLWIASARSGQMDVLDAKSFATVATIPVGKRCWHFSFTPDGRKALVACGRSDALTVIDTATLQAVSTLNGFKQPWGIVTYPKASGSLDAPGS
jgi:YVTN family beta-propeller protein